MICDAPIALPIAPCDGLSYKTVRTVLVVNLNLNEKRWWPSRQIQCTTVGPWQEAVEAVGIVDLIDICNMLGRFFFLCVPL